jgi:hypothetical protein
MNAATWLQRARRTPPVLALLRLLATPAAWWRELEGMRRSRYLYAELEGLMNEEFQLRQDLRGLEVVKHLHSDSDVRAKAVQRAMVLERRLGVVQNNRASLREEIGRLGGVVPL